MKSVKRGLITIFILSTIFAFIFTSLREQRFFAHHIPLNPIEYFGYGMWAFILVLIICFLTISFLWLILAKNQIKYSKTAKILTVVALIVTLVSSPYTHPVATINQIVPDKQPNISDKTIVVFTFDTEEDWVKTTPHCYLDSYKYIDSGAFEMLVDGFYTRDISATFFITPNVAMMRPQVLELLESKNQTIAVHLHPHNFVNITYPYCAPYYSTMGDDLEKYDYKIKEKWMKNAKHEIEDRTNQNITMFRSGKLSCGYEIEELAKSLGYKVISNHGEIDYIEPIGIYNIGPTHLLELDKLGAKDYMVVINENTGRIIIFNAHPMLLYDHEKTRMQEAMLHKFFIFIDDLMSKDDIIIMDMYELYDELDSLK